MTDPAPTPTYEPPRLGCAMCGHCCEQIHLTDVDLKRLELYADKIRRGLGDPADDQVWADEWLGQGPVGRPAPEGWQDEHRDAAIGTYHNARRLIVDGIWTEIPTGPPALAELSAAVNGHWFRCEVYDEPHRRCGDHENRPPICRLAPWYGEPTTEGKPPYPGAASDLRGETLACSYQLDIPAANRTGRVLIPLEVVRG